MNGRLVRWGLLMALGSLLLACGLPQRLRTVAACLRAQPGEASLSRVTPTSPSAQAAASMTPTMPACATETPLPNLDALENLARLEPLPPQPLPLSPDFRLQMIDSKHGWGFLRFARPDAPGGEDAVNAYGVRILVTEDGGETWHEVTPFVPGHPEVRFMPYTAQAQDAQRAWAVSYDEGLMIRDEGVQHFVVWHTDDGGQTWQWQVVHARYSHTPLVHRIVFSDDQHIWLFGTRGIGMYKADVGLFMTEDGGRTWRQVTSTSPDCLTLPADIAFAPHSLYGIVTLAETPADGGGYCVTHDGGKTWASQWFRPWEDSYGCGLFNLVLWDVGEGLMSAECMAGSTPMLVVLHDGAGEWTWPFEAYEDYVWEDLDAPTPNEVYAVLRKSETSQKVLLFSDDGGRTWTPRAEFEEERASFTWIPGGEGWALFTIGYDDEQETYLAHTVDGGVHWVPIMEPSMDVWP